MLMTSLRIYSGGKKYRNQASEKGGIVALLLSDWSVADKLPVNIHTPHPIPSSTHTHCAKAWWSSLSTTWRLLLLHLAKYMSPILSQVFLSWASLGIWDWLKKNKTLFSDHHPLLSPTYPNHINRPASKPRTCNWVFGKMGCLGNSKTEDQRNEEKAQREANKKIEKQLQKDKQIYRATHRLLLLGRFCEI